MSVGAARGVNSQRAVLQVHRKRHSSVTLKHWCRAHLGVGGNMREARQVQCSYKDCMKGTAGRSMGSCCLSVAAAFVGPQRQASAVGKWSVV